MTWWTEPDPHRARRNADAATERVETLDDGAVTRSIDTQQATVRLDAQPTQPMPGAQAPATATQPMAEAPQATRVLPTALVPESRPRGDDSPTVAVGRVGDVPVPLPPGRMPNAAPLNAAYGPLSPQEIRDARSHRARPRLGGFGWFRLLVGQLLLSIGLLLLAGGLALGLDGDLAAVWSLPTWIGLPTVLVGWLVLPGPIGGTISAILLSGIAWVAMLAGLWVHGTEGLQATIGAQATTVITAWALPITVLTLLAGAWLAARGKHPASLIVLLVPIAVGVGAAFVIEGGWLLGAVPTTWWEPVTTQLAPVIDGWFPAAPDLAAAITLGIDGWIRVAAVQLVVMLLAWPLRSTNTARG